MLDNKITCEDYNKLELRRALLKLFINDDTAWEIVNKPMSEKKLHNIRAACIQEYRFIKAVMEAYKAKNNEWLANLLTVTSPSRQIFTKKPSADQAGHTFWNAGFNYSDIEIKDYYTVKVEVVDLDKLKAEGAFWDNDFDGEKGFKIGDVGYVAISADYISHVSEWGLKIVRLYLE